MQTPNYYNMLKNREYSLCICKRGYVLDIDSGWITVDAIHAKAMKYFGLDGILNGRIADYVMFQYEVEKRAKKSPILKSFMSEVIEPLLTDPRLPKTEAKVAITYRDDPDDFLYDLYMEKQAAEFVSTAVDAMHHARPFGKYC